MDKVDVVIVGGGPAGVSSAIWCNRLELDHLLIESNPEIGGQLLQIHNKIIDYPGVVAKDGQELQTVFCGHLQSLGCNIVTGTTVLNIDSLNKKLTVTKGTERREIAFKFLIFTTGSKQRELRIPGEREMMERGENYSASRDNKQLSGKQVAVIGGGDRALEGALLLAEQGAKVTLLHRSSTFRAQSKFQELVRRDQRINLITNAIVKSIGGQNKVEEIEIEQHGKHETMKVDAVLVRIGVEPISGLLDGQVDTDHNGYILVDKVGQTSVPYIFAAGDVCNPPFYTSIASSVGQGMMAVKHISRYLNSDGPVYY